MAQLLIDKHETPRLLESLNVQHEEFKAEVRPLLTLLKSLDGGVYRFNQNVAAMYETVKELHGRVEKLEMRSR